MMNEPYWGLFWTTGMPEAWLMGRERMRQLENAAGLRAEGTAGGEQSSPPDEAPGNPQGFA